MTTTTVEQPRAEKQVMNQYDIARILLEGMEGIGALLDREDSSEASEKEGYRTIKEDIIEGRRQARAILNNIKKTGKNVTPRLISMGIAIFYRDNPEKIDKVIMYAAVRGYLSKLEEEFDIRAL